MNDGVSLDINANDISTDVPVSTASQLMDLPTFLRLFQLRKAQIMWFLGAGASRSAGIKTAGDMIWEFKQKLYCSEKKCRFPSSPIPATHRCSIRCRRILMHKEGSPCQERKTNIPCISMRHTRRQETGGPISMSRSRMASLPMVILP